MAVWLPVRTIASAAPGRNRVLVGLVLAMGLAAMDTTIVATAIPSIVRDLGGFSLFAWVFSIYVLVQAVSVPIYGKLADLYGRKPLLLIRHDHLSGGFGALGPLLEHGLADRVPWHPGYRRGRPVPIIFTVVGDSIPSRSGRGSRAGFRVSGASRR